MEELQLIVEAKTYHIEKVIQNKKEGNHVFLYVKVTQLNWIATCFKTRLDHDWRYVTLQQLHGYLPRQQDSEFQCELLREIAWGFRALGSSTEKNSVFSFAVQCGKRQKIFYWLEQYCVSFSINKLEGFNLAMRLRFKENEILRGSIPIISPFMANMEQNTALHVYTDIIQNRLVGHVRAPYFE